MDNKKILLTVEKTQTGFSAFSEDYPIFTTGKSIPELINNAYEATALYFGVENNAANISYKLNGELEGRALFVP